MNESASSSGHTSNIADEGGRVTLSMLAPSQQWPHATRLFNQGLPAADVYFIDHGLVKLVHVGQDGKELIVGLRSSGKVLGGPSVILGEAYPVSAVTLTPCSLRRIPATVLTQALKTDPVAINYLLKESSREVLDQLSQLIDSGLPALHRLKKLLVKFAREISETHWPDEARVPLLLKHWEIAQMIAVTPQHLSRLLKDIQDQDSIRIRKGCLIIPNPAQFGPDT
jgi:CRP/FNR family transcriptional regulator